MNIARPHLLSGLLATYLLGTASSAVAQNQGPIIDAIVADQTVASGGSLTFDLNNFFSDPDVESAIQFQTAYGTIQAALFDSAMPITVGNFKNYVQQSGASGGGFTGQGPSGTGETFFHRSPGTGFVVQAGSFYSEADGTLGTIPTDAPIPLETSLSSPQNLRGTLAMARTSSPNSATSGFYINTSDNGFLDYADTANPGYAVFGRILGNGMTAVDQVDSLPTQNLGGAYSTLPFDDQNNDSVVDAPDDLATITSMAIIEALGYGITSDNPTLVSSTMLDDRQVRFDFASGQTGTAEITITAQDLEGASIFQKFLFRVTPVPEPSSAFLVAISLTLGILRRRRTGI